MRRVGLIADENTVADNPASTVESKELSEDSGTWCSKLKQRVFSPSRSRIHTQESAVTILLAPGGMFSTVHLPASGIVICDSGL